MNNSIFNYLLILLFFLLIGCEEKKNNETSELEPTTENFPTVEKVEYVFACIQANEDNLAYMQKCSCSIDYIESQITYDDYVNAETITSLRQIYGEKSLMFRNTPNAMKIYTDLQNLLAEAEMECF